MGVLAIGTFYITTIVLGLCANRCLTDDDPDDDDENKVLWKVKHCVWLQPHLRLVQNTFHIFHPSVMKPFVMRPNIYLFGKLVESNTTMTFNYCMLACDGGNLWII